MTNYPIRRLGSDLLDMSDLGYLSGRETGDSRAERGLARVMGDACNVSNIIATESNLAEAWLARRTPEEKNMSVALSASVGNFMSTRTLRGRIDIHIW